MNKLSTKELLNINGGSIITKAFSKISNFIFTIGIISRIVRRYY